MRSSKVIIAAAGSGKTRAVIEEALANIGKRILITTYTNENLASIRSRIIKRTGLIPEGMVILSWFRFLLRDGARPYQNQMGQIARIAGINYHSDRMSYSRKFRKKSTLEYYVDSAHNLYSDQVSDFVCESDLRSGGLVIKRLESVYDMVLIDEMQDLAAYDLDFLELLLGSRVHLLMVGDPRQSTYTTSRSRRKWQYKRTGITDWIDELSKTKGLKVERKTECFRCNQVICDLADSLYPGMVKTVSRNDVHTGHDGVFALSRGDVRKYCGKYRPAILRYDRRTDTCGYDALNFGLAKGREFDRVLIFPTKDIGSCFRQGDFGQLKGGTRSKLYVAITRAKHSVAFVTE